MKRSLILLAGLVLVLASRGMGATPDSTTAPASTTVPSTPAPTSAAAAPTAPAPARGGGRNLSKLHVCELVTPQEVASMAGGKVFQDALQSSSERSALCVYHIGFPRGDYQQYRIHLQPPNLVEPLVECCAADLGRPIKGLGDIAFLKQDEKGLFRLLVLVKNDFALELTANATGQTAVSEKMLRRLAETVLTRMKK